MASCTNSPGACGSLLFGEMARRGQQAGAIGLGQSRSSASSLLQLRLPPPAAPVISAISHPPTPSPPHTPGAPGPSSRPHAALCPASPAPVALHRQLLGEVPRRRPGPGRGPAVHPVGGGAAAPGAGGSRARAGGRAATGVAAHRCVRGRRGWWCCLCRDVWLGSGRPMRCALRLLAQCRLSPCASCRAWGCRRICATGQRAQTAAAHMFTASRSAPVRRTLQALCRLPLARRVLRWRTGCTPTPKSCPMTLRCPSGEGLLLLLLLPPPPHGRPQRTGPAAPLPAPPSASIV